MYTAADSGELRIRQLGYKQELRRNFTVLSNASIGFTAISVLTGITGKPPPRPWSTLICSCAQQLSASMARAGQLHGLRMQPCSTASRTRAVATFLQHTRP